MFAMLLTGDPNVEAMTFGQTLLSILVELIVVIVLVCGLVCMKISGKKGESPAWTLCGLLGPIGIVICIFCDKIAAAFKKKAAKPAPQSESATFELSEPATFDVKLESSSTDSLSAFEVADKTVSLQSKEEKKEQPFGLADKK